MTQMIHSKYGYEPPEWVQADAWLDKWCKDKRRAKQHGAFSLDKNKEVQYESKRVRNNASHQRSLL
ncbi:prophage P2a protein 32 [Lactiplantibacillus plantarum]|nr:prophage P2a protein 32 [Lactiplantibacillus plantarum]